MFCPSMSKIKISVRILMASLDGGREGRRVEESRVNLAENMLFGPNLLYSTFFSLPSIQTNHRLPRIEILTILGVICDEVVFDSEDVHVCEICI